MFYGKLLPTKYYVKEILKCCWSPKWKFTEKWCNGCATKQAVFFWTAALILVYLNSLAKITWQSTVTNLILSKIILTNGYELLTFTLVEISASPEWICFHRMLKKYLERHLLIQSPTTETGTGHGEVPRLASDAVARHLDGKFVTSIPGISFPPVHLASSGIMNTLTAVHCRRED